MHPARLFLFILTPVVTSAAPVDYLREIKPLFQAQCVKCHGATSQKGDLKMDTAAALMRGGESGATLRPGKSCESLLVQLIEGTHAEIPKMPYKRPPLDSTQITLIRRWIDEGAKAPADEQPSDDRHWAFISPKRPPLPKSATHPVDAFIQVLLAKAGLTASPEAAPETLIRRLSLDLTGLPPTPEEVAAFVRDYQNPSTRPAQWQALVRRLLTSPHHGERWARWWLDQARYADSNGYSIDAPRQIWKYRDWVIGALNENLPFDRFTIEQIAGDMLPDAGESQKIATGFHRNTQINQEGGIDPEQFRIESVFDRVATTGTVWLGLTIGCAQCHDHKFDPISHKEYFQFFAFLNNQDEPVLKVTDPTLDVSALEAKLKQTEADLVKFMQEREAASIEWEKELGPESKKLLTKTAIKALATPREKRGFAEKRLLFAAGPGNTDQAFRALNEHYTEIDSKLKNGTTTLVMKEAAKPRKTTIFIKGDFTRPSDEVTSAVPAVLHPLEKKPSPDRLDLAHWLVSKSNPLTARVIMNRVWQQYFGRGLVETENDFGTMGSLPSHPELLDWLAVEFMESGWNLRHMHEIIVTSHTYRQSSSSAGDSPAKARANDTRNDLLWRQNRLRLDAEVVRDVSLAASGLLSPKIGGPPVYPPIPEGVLSLGQVKRAWPVSKGEDRHRRGLYTFVFRATPPPSLSVFDAPEGFSTCTRRIRSNTPLQALTLLNDTSYFEFAQAMEQIVKHDGIETAFQRCVSRKPHAEELKRLQSLDSLTIARVLLNLDETITRE